MAFEGFRVDLVESGKTEEINRGQEGRIWKSVERSLYFIWDMQGFALQRGTESNF